MDTPIITAAIAAAAAAVRFVVWALDRWDGRRHELAMARLEHELACRVRELADSEPPSPQ